LINGHRRHQMALLRMTFIVFEEALDSSGSLLGSD
jgi:hypothetical protein